MKQESEKEPIDDSQYGIINSMAEMEEVLDNISEEVSLDLQKNIVTDDGVIIYKFKHDRKNNRTRRKS